MPVNLFDANFYRAANSDLANLNDAEALSHFQNFGLNEGRAFSPFANLNFYRASNSDLASFNNQQAFDHLQNFGVAEGRRFSQFVDINFYLSANPSVNQAVEGNRERALEHLRDTGLNQGRTFSPFVSSLTYYLTVNPDVNQALGGNRVRALEHLEINGVAEGRSFSPYVDLSYYLSNNPDLNQALGGNRTLALEHIENFGLDQGRQFSPAFDVNFYRNNYPDLTNAGLTTNRSLFEHWVSNGAFLDRRFGTPDPGNSLDNALNLGSPATSATFLNNFVDSSDSSDYYRPTLNEPRNIGAELFGLSADLDLTLLDNNGNVIANSSGDASAGDLVSYFELNPGTYFIRVNQGVPDTSSNYTMGVAVLPAQDPGATPSNAYGLSSAVPPLNTLIRGSVGGSDTDDYYRFNLTRNSSWNAQLNSLSANADLYLLNSTGTTIASSNAGSTDQDSIPSTSLTPGTYFVRISGSSSNTDYSLNVNLV